MKPMQPELEPLPRGHRRLIFITTIVVFFVTVPALAFYAAGYRIDLADETQSIKTVGGMYISTTADDVLLFVDEEPVEDMRVFQQAAYIQNLDAGQHDINAQGDALQTWTKSLPVHAHLVTEAASFNVPERPQIRLISEYQTSGGVMVVSPEATTTFAFASSTNLWLATSTVATSSFIANTEYPFVATLFASSTEEIIARALEAEAFTFSSATTSTSTPVATTTKQLRDIELREVGEEVIALWQGNDNDQPYYYCINYLGASTSDAYGEHVVSDLIIELAGDEINIDGIASGTRLCRDSIRIDRLRQSVQWFDFYPDNRDLVLMLLDDGLYVVEIDDRAWQNAQLLYPGSNLQALRNGNQILIKDGEYYLEVFTELSN